MDTQVTKAGRGGLSLRAVVTMAALAAASGALFGFHVMTQYLQARGG